LSHLDNDSNIFVAIAKVFWQENKPTKTKAWLKKAIALNKDNGDAWAHLFRFESDFGNEDSQKEVLNDFIEAEPHHGDIWAREAKKVENWRKGSVDVLKKAALNIKLFN